MVKTLSMAYGYLMKLIKLILVIVSVLMTAVVFVSVLSRFVFNNSVPWADEASRFLFIWLVFIGSVLGCDAQRHVHLNLLVEISGKRTSMVMRFTAKILMLLTMCVLFAGGLTVFLSNLDWMTPALRIPYGLVYFVAPFSLLIMIGQTIAHIVALVNECRGNKHSEELIMKGGCGS